MSSSITTTSTSTSGSLRLRVVQRGGQSVLAEAAGHVPYAPRLANGREGWAKVVLVQTVAGPLSGDRTEVEVEVEDGAALELGTNAATLAFPAASPARHEVRIRLGRGARLVWRPEPLILAAGCNLEASLLLELAPGAAALAREAVLLGRHGEQPGRYRGELRCELDGSPLLHDAVVVDPEGASQRSGAVLAGAGAFASLALLGLDPEEPCGPGQLDLAGPGRVLRALAPGTATLKAELEPVEAAWGALIGC